MLLCLVYAAGCSSCVCTVVQSFPLQTDRSKLRSPLLGNLDLTPDLVPCLFCFASPLNCCVTVICAQMFQSLVPNTPCSGTTAPNKSGLNPPGVAERRPVVGSWLLRLNTHQISSLSFLNSFAAICVVLLLMLLGFPSMYSRCRPWQSSLLQNDTCSPQQAQHKPKWIWWN